MNFLAISRILALCMVINEAYVVYRTPPEDRKQVILPPVPPVAILLIFLPFFFALDLPAWLAVPAVLMQAVGLVMEVFSEIQLTRARSFSIVADKGIEPQRTGFYRWFEHPIYVGILLQMIGWSLFMPVVFISLVLNFIAVRQMVHNEREYLAKTLNFTHQGIDTALWN
jgi:protein-S-isoprenylcysteine O-methyltransferase Ste14